VYLRKQIAELKNLIISLSFFGLVITQVQTNAVKTKNDVNEMHIGGVLKLNQFAATPSIT
jgi:hypothetical protein